MTEPIGVVRSVLLATASMDQLCTFFAETLGFRQLLRDGDRWAEFDGGGVRVALSSEFHEPGLALNVKVADVAVALERALAGGARLVRPSERGAHEVSASFQDPGGHLINIYEPL